MAGPVPLRGVIFDLGWTLIDLEGPWDAVHEPGARALAAYVAERVPEVDAAEFARVFLERWRAGRDRVRGTTDEVVTELVLADVLAEFHLDPWDEAMLAEAVRRWHGPEMEAWRPFPDATGVLDRLAGMGLRLGLISNASSDRFVLEALDRYGWVGRFEPAVSSAGHRKRKPHPSIFRRVLDAWGFDPGAVCMVGDTLAADVAGAHAVGMRAIHVTMRYWEPVNGPLEGKVVPDARAASLTRVAEIAARWAAGRV